LTGGRRTALPRHQTLRATLDWSYALLLDFERLILCRLAVFSGIFSLEAACAAATSPGVTSAQVVAALSELVAKSLVVTEMAPVAWYRLLDTTRAYALEKLAEGTERERIARLHAEYYRDLFQYAGLEVETLPSAEWLCTYRPQLDNLRVALNWAFAARVIR
jgi:predicted ATPase